MKWSFKLFCFWGFVILIISVQTAFAQPYSLRFQHLSVEHGLSANMVYCITQDKHGFIWLGTNDGLNRFDGHKAEVFRHRIGDKNAVPDNAFLSLFTDSRGIVWGGSANGLTSYDEQTQTFRSFFMNPKDKNSLPNNSINIIREDSRGLIWIGTGRGLCSFDVKTNRFQRFFYGDPSNSLVNNEIIDLQFANDGILWIATRDGLNRFDPASGYFNRFFHDPADSFSLSGNVHPRFTIDEGGNLWTGFISDDKLYLDCFDTKTHRTKHFLKTIRKPSIGSGNYSLAFNPLYARNSVSSVLIDKKGRLWIGTTQSGLILFLPDKNNFYEYQKGDPFDPASLQSNNIFWMYNDRAGMIWLGTISGAERFNPDESKFLLYRLQSGQSVGTGQKSVQVFAEDALHRLWIGTSDGVSIMDRNTGMITNYRLNQEDNITFNENFVTSLCRDKQGNMWIGTLNGLKLYDPAHNHFRSFYAENNNHSLAHNLVTSIVCDNNGDLLISNRPGFTIYHTQSRRFENFNNDSLHALLNSRNNIVFEDKRGILWLGTQGNGLIRYDRKNGKLEKFTKNENDTSSLAATFVSSITQDHKGVIWIGTRTGLSRFNENIRTFTTYTVRNGLANDRIKQMLVDEKDRIWMATNRGISMLDESRTTFTNYDPSDGLQGWEFSEPSAFKTHDCYFCFGGPNGFNMFHPDSIRKNLFVPPVMVSGIKIFDQPLNDRLYPYLNPLRLSYKQNFFSFEFAAMNYDHPEKNQFACQLIGFDKKMVKLGTNHSISYTNVPPGNYTLKVMASNNDNIWNEAGYELKLIIGPPFWATTWFRIIMVILFIGLVFFFVKLRERRIKREQAHLTAINKQIAELRMTALQAQMNPHFIFNCLNSIQQLISIREKGEAIIYLSKFSKLIRRILENSLENTVSISNELELLELYIQLEQLRFSHKFDYHIVVGEMIDRENTEIPPLLLQPFIENAILHGLVNKNDKGDLWLTLERNNGLLVCKIEDNGIGRTRAQEIEQRKAAKHRSLGMKMTGERMSTMSALLGYTVEVRVEDLFENDPDSTETGEPAGTRVTIYIPVNEEG